MPIFTAAATFIAAAIGVTSVLGIAAINLGVRVLATVVVSSLIANRIQDKQEPSGSQPVAQTTGSRVQLPASTDNKIGVVYGSAFISPAMIDAKISTDQKTMWYCMALCEVTDTGIISMGDVDSVSNTNIFWGDKELFFDPTDKTKVIKTVNSNGEEDVKVNGFMFVYLYKNGSANPVNTSETAIQVMSDSQIDAGERWNGARYTFAGSSPTMANTSFVIVKLIYNQDANLTGIDQFKIQITNSLTKPGDVIYDYLTNARYGCAIATAQVDTDSIDALNTYSDELITYTPIGGGTATQARYRINGPVNTGSNCLSNLQYMIDACDSWLQWNESIAKWSVIPNQSYLDYTIYDDLFLIDSNNLISGINISPVDLNATYNIVESQFPNNKIKDQSDYNFVYLAAEDMNPNEPVNKLTIQYPQVSNSVQVQYLATRRMIQSREDLFANFTMDYSGIQINAGDVVRIRHEAYGWGPTTEDPTALDKLFRVDQVQEIKNDDGTLQARLSCFEYNNQVFENIDIDDYEPAANTGLTNPLIVGKPNPPTFSDEDSQGGTFIVNCVIPTPGQVIAMEFWFGPTPTIENNNYKLWETQTNSSGPVYAPGATEQSQVVGFTSGDYYWAVRAVTQSTKSEFSNSTNLPWSPALPATRQVCTQTTTTTVSFTDLYKLWAPGTRGTVLSCDYTPQETGSDAGGKATNQIQVDLSNTNYMSGTSTGLVTELWVAVKGNFETTALGYGSNGFAIGLPNGIRFTGNIQGATSANPDTYVGSKTTTPGVVWSITSNGGTTYVAVGDNGGVYYSLTGYNNWTVATIPGSATTINFNEVVWNGSIFVAVGGVFSTSTMYILSSTDGITWTQRLNNTGTYSILYGVAWNGSSFLAAGAGFTAATSSDGITWTPFNVAGGSIYSANSVTWSQGFSRWIVVGKNSSNFSVAFTSPDANTFTIRYTSSSSSTELYGVSTNYASPYDDTFAAGLKGEIIYSDDGGLTWAVKPSGTISKFNYCEKLNNSFIIGGSSATKPFIWPITTSSISFDVVDFWETIRLFAFGSDQNDPYSTTIQPVQNQQQNNIPLNTPIRTGSYIKALLTRYLLVAGDLNNPSTPSTLYSSRKTLAITEFLG
jgi:hypothetical protein